MQTRNSQPVPRRPQRKLLVKALALACAAPASGLTAEPEGQPESDEKAAPVEEVLVIGRTEQIRRALADQRDADVLKSIIHSDGINSLPDSNASEALQRLPGISIERDQGEGRFVRIRGTAPDLNNTTIDGVRLPAPEDDRRGVALDVLPTDLIDSLVVTKALTPDMDADAVGGSVDVQSVSALDRDGPYYKLSGQGGYNGLSEELSPKAGLSGGNTFALGEGRLGVAGAVSFEEREFGSDNTETGGGWNFEEQQPLLEEIEQRDYTSITRERIGVGLNLDYEYNANNRYFIRNLYTRFEDDEQRNTNIFEFEDGIAQGEAGDPEVERELKDRIETQEILSVKAGGEHLFNGWTLNYEASFSEASEEEGFEEPALSEAIFVPEEDIQGVSFSGRRTPRLSVPDSFFDNTNFVLDSAEFEKGEVTDEEFGARLDLKHEFVLRSHPASIQIGAKGTRRTKERDITLYAFEDFEDNGIDPARLGLENFAGGEADFSLGRFGSILRPEPIRDLLSELDRESFLDEEASRVEDFEIDEDITAGYAMGTIDINALRLIGGVRYEDTRLDGKGTRLDNGEFGTVESSNDYDNLLGYLHARYALTPRTLVRASFTQSLARPVFEQLSPAIVRDEDEVEFGNPGLEPLEANNLDLGIEHYIDDTSAVSAHLFYKDIENFIFESDLAGTGQTIRGLDMDSFDEAVTFQNGEGADLYGVELAASHRFYWLPGIWQNLLLEGNLTLTKSDASIKGFNQDTGAFEERDIDLPRQSDTTGNFTVGYEDANLSLRLAGSFKSEHLLEIGDPLDETQDLYEDDHFQLDFAASYQLMNQLQVQFDAINLTDRPFFAFQNNESFNAQFEEYGRTYRLGVTYAGF